MSVMYFDFWVLKERRGLFLLWFDRQGLHMRTLAAEPVVEENT
jgi:hypothetical protein